MHTRTQIKTAAPTSSCRGRKRASKIKESANRRLKRKQLPLKHAHTHTHIYIYRCNAMPRCASPNGRYHCVCPSAEPCSSSPRCACCSPHQEFGDDGNGCAWIGFQPRRCSPVHALNRRSCCLLRHPHRERRSTKNPRWRGCETAAGHRCCSPPARV